VVVAQAAHERRLERRADVSPLDQQVVVAETVPLGESHSPGQNRGKPIQPVYGLAAKLSCGP
jgi:hypothetical protein